MQHNARVHPAIGTTPRRSTTWVLLVALTTTALWSAASLGQAPSQPTAAKEIEALELIQKESLAEAVERARSFPAEIYPSFTPHDERWLAVDDVRRAYVAKIHKEASRHARLEKKVRLSYGLTLDLLDEDDEHFFLLVVAPTEANEKKLIEQREANRARRQAEAKAAADAEARAKLAPMDHGDLSKLAPTRVLPQVAPFDRGLPDRGLWRNDVYAADLNGDGNLDIFHPPPRKGRGRPAIFLGDGAGNWQHARAGIRTNRLEYGDAALADFDGDGQLDVALAMHLLGTTVLYGRGNLQFEERAEGFDRPTWARPNSPFGKRAPWSSRAIAASDLDQDGDLDLIAIGEGAESLSMLRAERDPAPVFSEGLTIYMNNGESWTPHRFEKLPAGGNRVTVGDFDGDGSDELAVAWASSRGWNVIIDIRFENGLPQIEPQRLDTLGREITHVGAVAAADLIPGGTSELVVGRLVKQREEWRGRIEIHARENGEASGPWQAYTLADWPLGEAILDVEVGDLDGDDVLDIVASTNASRIVILRGLSDGRFQLADQSPSPVQHNCQAFSVELADLDGDGGDEIISGFAGETSSFPGIGTMEGCANNGRLSVWKVTGFEDAAPDRTGPSLEPYEFKASGMADPNEALLNSVRRSGR